MTQSTTIEDASPSSARLFASLAPRANEILDRLAVSAAEDGERIALLDDVLGHAVAHLPRPMKPMVSVGIAYSLNWLADFLAEAGQGGKASVASRRDSDAGRR